MIIISMGMPYLMMDVKASKIVLIGVGVIPPTTGLLSKLLLVAIRARHKETTYFCMHQDWA